MYCSPRPDNFKQLQDVLTAYDDSYARFKHILSKPPTGNVAVKDVRLNPPQILQRTPTKERIVEFYPSVEELSAELAEPCLIVGKNDEALRTEGSR